MNFGWFAGIIVHHPYIILSAVVIVSGTCMIVPFTLNSMSFPKFQDPQMGFSTRGTIISNRLTAWGNLVKSFSPSGEFTSNPKEFLELEMQFRNNSLSPYKPPKEMTKPRKKRKKQKNKKPVFGNVSIHEPITTDNKMTDEERWKAIQNLKPNPKRKFNSQTTDQFFCGSPDERYAHLVVSTENKEDLFTIGNMLAMCRLERELTRLTHYEDLCIQNAEKKCCKPWSLPNYIALLNDKTSCLTIMEEDIVATKELLATCAPYFHIMELNPDCFKTRPYCGAPLECIRHDAVFNILNYLTSTSFLPPNNTEGGTELKEAMIFLPMACSVGMLPYYHELEKHNLEYDGVKVVAMEFGIKSALFDECLLRDTWFMSTGASFIVLSIWLYTQSLFLTFITITVILFSLAISYFMYFLVYGINFFPFMNLLATIVAVGIGADDAFIFCKIWHIEKLKPEHTLLEVMTETFRHAFISMFVTALTTAVAFLGSYVSAVTAVSCFSIFAGTAVIANYVLMMTWFPASLVLWERSSFSHMTLLRSCAMLCFQRWCCWRPQWNLSTSWFKCPNLKRIWMAKDEFLLNTVIQYKYYWFILLSVIAALSGIVVFVYPKLQLPNTSEFQLFESSHPFEQYDFVYKNKFWFRKAERGQDHMNYKLPLRFVWGILPIDNGDYLDPKNLGTLTLDSDFDMSDPKSQEFLKDFCQDLRQQPFYHSTMGPLLSNCFIETFMKSMKRKCYNGIDNQNRTPCCETSKFPFSKTVFEECVIDEVGEIYKTPPEFLNAGMSGPKFSKDQYPIIKAVVIEYDSTYSYTMSYEQMHEFFVTVEEWMEGKLATAPEIMKNGFFISDLQFYDLQRELSESTQIAVAISMCLALVVLFLSTLNILTSFYAIITITNSIFVTMAIFVLLGWKLNILESVAVSTAIGLTVDFSLHYSVNYKLCPEALATDREGATRHALSYMAGPALMAAITTGTAGAFMMPSMILPYIQIGSFLLLVMCISWVYATFFLGPLLAIAGPNRNCGQFRYSNLVGWFRKPKRAEEGPEPLPTTSSAVEVHELHSLTCTKRDRPTPKPVRRSLSSGGARYTPSKSVFTDQSPSPASAISIIMPDDN